MTGGSSELTVEGERCCLRTDISGQCGGGFLVPALSGEVQRDASRGIPGAGIRSMPDQPERHFCPTENSRRVQGRVSESIPRMEVGSTLQQEGGGPTTAVHGRHMQRSHPRDIMRGDVSPGVKQQTYCLYVIDTGGCVQRGFPKAIHLVHGVRIGLEEMAQGVELSAGDQVMGTGLTAGQPRTHGGKPHRRREN